MSLYSKIVAFVKQLNNEFGSKQKSLRLFYHLLEQSPESNKNSKKIIHSTCNVFTSFLQNNADKILAQQYNELKPSIIELHDNINIKIVEIFRMATEDSRKSIWQYLTLMLSDVNDSKEAKDMITMWAQQERSVSNHASSSNAQFPSAPGAGSEEQKFIGELFRDMNSSLSQSSDGDTGQLVSQIMGKVINKLTTKELNPAQLLSAMMGAAGPMLAQHMATQSPNNDASASSINELD